MIDNIVNWFIKLLYPSVTNIMKVEYNIPSGLIKATCTNGKWDIELKPLGWTDEQTIKYIYETSEFLDHE